MNETFCAAPWTQLATKPNGSIRICCLMTNSDDPDQGTLKRKDGTVFNAKDSDFLESFNASKSCQLRNNLISGKKDSLCKTCWDKEEIGLKSKRQVTNRIFREEIANNTFINNMNSDGSLKQIQLGYLDLRFGNLCNLKCIMCHPASSSKWYDDYVKIHGETHFFNSRDKVQLKSFDGRWAPENNDYFKWYENEIFWKSLEENFKNIRQIYSVGGEPLLIKEHFKLLEYCVDKNISKQIVLEYDTNLTILNKQIFDLWANFKKVKLRASIDAIGPKNDYIRFPSSWSQICDNLSLISKCHKNIELDLSVTWQIYNLFAITEIFEHFKFGTIRTLSSPRYLDPKILPRPLKERAISHFNNFIHENKKIVSQIHSLSTYLSKYIDYESDEHLKDFKNYTSKCDNIRGTNFIKTFPELEGIFI